ncbi:MAG: hypothetical protein JWM16_2204 [Verrucomicrobiales bacterium]|nr:hypothetical protein [Verrucomicrobiales bacterium]
MLPKLLGGALSKVTSGPLKAHHFSKMVAVARFLHLLQKLLTGLRVSKIPASFQGLELFLTSRAPHLRSCFKLLSSGRAVLWNPTLLAAGPPAPTEPWLLEPSDIQ